VPDVIRRCRAVANGKGTEQTRLLDDPCLGHILQLQNPLTDPAGVETERVDLVLVQRDLDKPLPAPTHLHTCDTVDQQQFRYYQLDKQFEGDLLSELEHSVRQSHAIVQSAAESTPERQGMATTLTVVHVLWPTAYLVHVGDSRCYLFRDSGLTQLTRDQTLAQDMVERGVLTADRADDSEWSHMLSGAVGAQIAPDTSKVELARGDTLLLCTDGLTKHLKTAQITDVLRVAESAEGACRKLVTTALDRGGTDNVTVVVSRFA